jgi:sugar phosphate permease
MTTIAPVPANPSSKLVDAFVTRQLRHYPRPAARYGYLAIVTLTTVTLYYLYYVEGTVTPLLLPYYHMSFLYFLYLLVVSNAIGAFSAFIGGLSDKIGRANLTIFGTLLVGLLQLIAIPNIHSKFAFAATYCVIGFVEGIILVSTPALMRDFSPQLGRGSAMGLWALGPTMGSLVASLVATRTLSHLTPWQDQFIISGLVCMGVVAISFVLLRELSPQLRDQLIVSQRERSLVEARAMGIDVERAISRPVRSMMRPELVVSSIAISVFLLIYYASVSVLTIYWVVVFNRSTADANGINTWYWAFDAGTLVVIGALSDRLRVRKPFMVFGAVAAIVMTIVLIAQIDHPRTGYYSNVLVVVLLGFAIGCAYTPWMANYTERVEARNPALAATGLAIWGWILRIVVAISFLVLPRVITTSTTLVDNQSAANVLKTIQAAQPYAPSTSPAACASKSAPPSVITDLKATDEPGPITLAKVIEGCNKTHNILLAITAAGGLSNPQVAGLIAYSPLATSIQQGHSVSDAEIYAKVGVHSHNLASLLVAEKKLVPAQKASPGEWRRWWWVCVAGQAVFLLLVFTMRGRWSPRSARRDLEEHERKVTEELAAIRRDMAPAGAGDVGPGP